MCPCGADAPHVPRRLCPISLQVMRRPVLPSSGQAYDEVNIARFSAAGKSQCPVSGAPLECHRRGPSKGKVMLTPDYALRNVIRHQAQQAKAIHHPYLYSSGGWLCVALQA